MFLKNTDTFDCADFSILKWMFYKYGVRGNAINLFQSYFIIGGQHLFSKNLLSPLCYIDRVVHRGSSFRTYLFLHFINYTLQTSFFLYFNSTLTIALSHDYPKPYSLKLCLKPTTVSSLTS